MPGKAELNTLIFCLTHITILVVITRTASGELDQQILCGIQVGLNGTIQLSTEEGEIKTDVTGNGGLPFQIRIGHCLRRCPVRTDTIYPSCRAGAIGLYELSDRDVVITCSTIADAELQVVKPLLCALHEWLRRDTPCKCYRGEVTPAVFLRELRRSIGTECSAQKIAVLEVVVQTAEE